MAAYVTSTHISINRAYKDTVFRDLFGSARWKAYTLSLYNALNGTAYSNLDDLELTTIDNVIYMGYKNDVSFLVGDQMVLWEHQSTYNPNMPLRGLIYFAELYNKLVDASGNGMFSERALVLPTPRYFVFYIGPEDKPDREVLRLSSSFADGPGDLEVTATVLNVNEGHNEGIMEACEALAGYAHLVELARMFAQSMSRADAIEAAIRQCIEEGVLKEYLVERRSEVVGTFLTEWDEEEYRAFIRKEYREIGYADGKAQGLEEGIAEGRAEGRAEGHAEGRAEALEEIAQLVRDGLLDPAVAEQRFGLKVYTAEG